MRVSWRMRNGEKIETVVNSVPVISRKKKSKGAEEMNGRRGPRHRWVSVYHINNELYYYTSRVLRRNLLQ